jgi:hypothetical protein
MLEAEVRRIAIQGHSGQNAFETPSQQKKAGHGGIHTSSQLWWEAKIGGSSLGKKRKHMSQRKKG